MLTTMARYVDFPLEAFTEYCIHRSELPLLGRLCCVNNRARHLISTTLNFATDRRLGRALVARTAQGVAASDTNGPKYAAGLQWLIDTAHITPLVMAEDTPALIRISNVHYLLKKVLVSAGVHKLTLGDIAAAAREQVEGVHEWIAELCAAGYQTGLPAVVEAICMSNSLDMDDPHPPLTDAELVDCCYIEINTLSSQAGHMPQSATEGPWEPRYKDTWRYLCDEAASRNMTHINPLLRWSLQLLAARQVPGTLASQYMKMLFSIPAARTALSTATDELLQLAWRQGPHIVEVMLQQLLDNGMQFSAARVLGMAHTAVSHMVATNSKAQHITKDSAVCLEVAATTRSVLHVRPPQPQHDAKVQAHVLELLHNFHPAELSVADVYDLFYTAVSALNSSSGPSAVFAQLSAVPSASELSVDQVESLIMRSVNVCAASYVSSLALSSALDVLCKLPAAVAMSFVRVEHLLQLAVKRKAPCGQLLKLPAAAILTAVSPQLVRTAYEMSLRVASEGLDLVESIALLDHSLAQQLPKAVLVDVATALLDGSSVSGFCQLPSRAVSVGAVMDRFACLVETIAGKFTAEDGAAATRILCRAAYNFGQSVDNMKVIHRVWEALKHAPCGPTIDMAAVVESAVAHPNVVCFLLKLEVVRSRLTSDQLIKVLAAAVQSGDPDSVKYLNDLPAAATLSCHAVASLLRLALQLRPAGCRRDLIVCYLRHLMATTLENAVFELFGSALGGFNMAALESIVRTL